jgi:hypothetical protein
MACRGCARPVKAVSGPTSPSGRVVGDQEPAKVGVDLDEGHSGAGVGHDATQEVGQVVVLVVH